MDPSELFTRIVRLRDRRARDAAGLHFAEGVRNVLQALEARIDVEALLVSEVLLRNAAAQKRVRLARRAGVAVVRVSPEAFRSVSGTARASGIGALLRQHWRPLAAADPRRGLCTVAVSALRSPGNLGTILRTLEAAGGGRLVCLGDALDPFDPDVVRAAMGGLYGIEVVRARLDTLRRWTRAHGCVVVATSPSAPLAYTEVPVGAPLVLLLGEERQGLRPEELALATHSAHIPVFGRADSLNVGVAAGILLYDLVRRRGIAPPTRAPAAARHSPA